MAVNGAGQLLKAHDVSSGGYGGSKVMSVTLAPGRPHAAVHLMQDERAGWDFKRAVKDKTGQKTTAQSEIANAVRKSRS